MSSDDTLCELNQSWRTLSFLQELLRVAHNHTARALPVTMTAFTSRRAKSLVNPSSVISTLFEIGVRRFRLRERSPLPEIPSHHLRVQSAFAFATVLLHNSRIGKHYLDNVSSVRSSLRHATALPPDPCYFIFLKYFLHHRTMRDLTHNSAAEEASRMRYYAVSSGKQLPLTSRQSVTLQDT